MVDPKTIHRAMDDFKEKLTAKILSSVRADSMDAARDADVQLQIIVAAHEHLSRVMANEDEDYELS